MVARAGESWVGIAQVASWAERIGTAQIAAMAGNPDAIRHQLVEKVVIPRLLIAEESRRQKLAQSPPAKERIVAILRDARTQLLRFEIEAAIVDSDLSERYGQSRSRFEGAERLAVWRILCRTEHEAEEALAELRHEPSVVTWTRLVQAHSSDPETVGRKGDLGMIAADGSSHFAGRSVDPRLFLAAAGVRDGEWVDRPIPEGERFAVIWRRGTVSATHVTLTQARATLRSELSHERLQARLHELVQLLRERKHPPIETHADLIEKLGPLSDPAILKLPTTLRGGASGDPTPRTTPNGLR